MLEGIPRLSVMVITYNQENIVGRTLDSLIAQRDYLYEICISDDCSQDGTWTVLKDYQNRYPDLIKLHRQEQNVGIFENTEYQWTMPKGDIINEIAGDDTTPDGWYKAVIEFVINNRIDYQNELFCIYGNYQCIYPNGDSFIRKSDVVLNKKYDLISLALRSYIGGRGCCFSAKILGKYKKTSKGRSYIAESTQDRQLQLYTQKAYYINALSNVYYAQIGVSATLSTDKKRLQERVEGVYYTMNFLNENGANLSNRDIYFLKSLGEKSKNKVDGKFEYWIKGFYYSIRSLNVSYLSLYIKNIKRTLFAIRRRLPHKKPIFWTI